MADRLEFFLEKTRELERPAEIAEASWKATLHENWVGSDHASENLKEEFRTAHAKKVVALQRVGEIQDEYFRTGEEAEGL